jgi:Zn-finger nucleic acid-binding protein
MQCPKCHAEMEQVTVQGVEVDRCTQCKGLWFDDREKERLKNRVAAELLDTGDPEVGRRMNLTDRIFCPRCQAKMLRMVDPEQHHIWIESCPLCYGAFFDAGEFRDYAEVSVLDFLRDLFTKPRH